MNYGTLLWNESSLFKVKVKRIYKYFITLAQSKFCCTASEPHYLTHCGQVKWYGDRDLNQHWFMYWLDAWQHQAITWTNVDLSSVRSCGIHLRHYILAASLRKLNKKTKFFIAFCTIRIMIHCFELHLHYLSRTQIQILYSVLHQVNYRHCIVNASPILNSLAPGRWDRYFKSIILKPIIQKSSLDTSLQWRHNGLDGISNHQPHHCLLGRLFKRRSKKTSKLSVTGLFVGNSPGTGEFPAQMASNTENVSIWWHHHVLWNCCQVNAIEPH